MTPQIVEPWSTLWCSAFSDRFGAMQLLYASISLGTFNWVAGPLWSVLIISPPVLLLYSVYSNIVSSWSQRTRTSHTCCSSVSRPINLTCGGQSSQHEPIGFLILFVSFLNSLWSALQCRPVGFRETFEREDAGRVHPPKSKQ